MPKTNQWKITMVNLEKLATKRYPGFNTTKAIKQFCTRYHVNCFWWQPPQGTKKVLMIDEQNFRRCYKQMWVQKSYSPRATSAHTGTTPRQTTTTTSRMKQPARINSRTRTYSSHRTQSTKKTYRRAA